MKALLLDLETTGLDERRHVPIEVAARVLEPGSPPRETGRFHSLIRPGLTAMADISEPARAMHLASGLLDRVTAGDAPFVYVVDEQLTAFVNEHAGDDVVHLMGNSVHFDARFIRVHMPCLHARLHYRIIDVTSVCLFQELFTGTSPMDWEKDKAHTADADLDETWHEASVYAQRLKLAGD